MTGDATQLDCPLLVELYAFVPDVGEFPDQVGVLNIGVPFVGSWERRGHSSHSGIGVVIDLLNGLPLDYEVL